MQKWTIMECLSLSKEPLSCLLPELYDFLFHIMNFKYMQERWDTPLIPALRKERQVDISEFKASLVFRVTGSQGHKVRLSQHHADT